MATVFLVLLATLSLIQAKAPGLKADLSSLTTSGFSSGGVMTTQFHVAFSSKVKGAGVIGGGPYHCTQGNFTIAQ